MQEIKDMELHGEELRIKRLKQMRKEVMRGYYTY